MLELRKFVAPEFVFGLGAVDLVGQYSKNFGANRALVVTDPGVVDSGIVARVCSLLDSQSINYTVFAEISPNPRAEEVMAGANIYQQENCDVIISVGGGSPMDCAKGIGIVTTNGKNILKFEGIDNVTIPGPPLICIPTTAGTSADISQFAIITDRAEKVKIAIISKTMVPDVALIDPAVTISMNRYLTACTGMDALVHAFEAYVSTANSPILDLHALHAITLIRKNLVAVLDQPDDIDLRGKIMLGSLEAGIAFSNASLGAVHAMAHSCGGLLDLPHGECNAVLLDHVVTFNYGSAKERYKNIAVSMGVDVTAMPDEEVQKELLLAIRLLKHDVGITAGLGKRGAKNTDITELAKKAMKDPCMVTNPRLPSLRDIEVIYEEAL